MKQLIFLGIFSLFIVNKKLKVNDDPIKLKNNFELTFEKIQRLPWMPVGKNITVEPSRGNKVYVFRIEVENVSNETNTIDFNKITIVDKEKEAQFSSKYVVNSGAFQFPVTKLTTLKSGKKKSVNIIYIYDENKNPEYLKIGDEIIRVPYK